MNRYIQPSLECMTDEEIRGLPYETLNELSYKDMVRLHNDFPEVYDSYEKETERRLERERQRRRELWGT